MFTRPQVEKSGMIRKMRAGDGFLANLVPGAMSADAASTITVAMMQGGFIRRTGNTSAHTDTTDTAANILAANPNMDIGDTFVVLVNNVVAYAITVAGGTGVTMGTKTVIPASTFGFLIFTKTSSTTMTCEVVA
jgi:hypothetical protein